MKKAVIYTCVTNNYDCLTDPVIIDRSFDYICFADKKTKVDNKIKVWQIKKLAFSKLDNIRNARWHKTHPHLLFKEYKYSIYIDSNINILNKKFYQDIKEQIKNKALIAVQPHFARENIYEEFSECLRLKKDKSEIIKKQKYYLEKEKFNGKYYIFPETNIIFRSHLQDKVMAAMQVWWSMIKKYSYRDQLSFTYALWKVKLPHQLLSPDSYRFSDTISFAYKNKHQGGKISQVNIEELRAVLLGTQKELMKTRAELFAIKSSPLSFPYHLFCFLKNKVKKIVNKK